jgi:hypothetical protein
MVCCEASRGVLLPERDRYRAHDLSNVDGAVPVAIAGAAGRIGE